MSDNLQQFLVWALPTNGGEAMVIMLGIVLGVSLLSLDVELEKGIRRVLPRRAAPSRRPTC